MGKGDLVRMVDWASGQVGQGWRGASGRGGICDSRDRWWRAVGNGVVDVVAELVGVKGKACGHAALPHFRVYRVCARNTR